MKPFFNTQQTASVSRPDGKGRSCISCGLYKNVITPRMKPYGNFKRGILNIGEAGGADEDRIGKPWQGKTGQLLQRTYKKLGIDLFEDCLNVNSCLCRPMTKEGNNRTPTNQEIENCRHAVLQLIKNVQPHVIVLLGGSALYSLLGHRWRKNLGGISKWRGYTIPDWDFNAWLCPVFHPSFTERGEKEVETVWMQDLEHALSMTNHALPKFEDESKQVEIITDLSCLDDIQSPFAWDLETTGLKPHAQSVHRIICMSVYDGRRCVVFMMPTDARNTKHLRRLLQSNKKKIASNMKFETTWALNCLDIEITDWLFDTMLASHILDNRPDITSIKFQTLVNFGVFDYASEIASYLKSIDKKNGNSVNRIDELLKSEELTQKLLVYCGLDSIFEYKVAMVQMKQLGMS